MRRKRPYTEPDRIKERIRVINERKQFITLGDVPWNPLKNMVRRAPNYNIEHLPRGIFL